MKERVRIQPDKAVLAKYLEDPSFDEPDMKEITDRWLTTAAPEIIAITKALVTKHSIETVHHDNIAAFLNILFFHIGGFRIFEEVGLFKFADNQHNQTIRVRDELIKIFGERPDPYRVADEISAIELTIRGVPIKCDLMGFKLALIPRIKTVLEASGNIRTKPLKSKTRTISSLMPLGRYLYSEGALKTRNQVYVFMQSFIPDTEVKYIRDRMKLPSR